MNELKSIIVPYIPFYEHVKDGVVITNLKGIIAYVNDSIEKLVGQDAKYITGNRCSDVFSTPAIFNEILLEVGLRKRTSREIIVQIGDQRKAINIFSTIIYDEKNIPIGLIFIFHLVYPSKVDLSSYEGKLSILPALDNRTDEVFILTDIIYGKTIFCSNATERILGWSTDDFINGGWILFATLIHPDDITQILVTYSEGLISRQNEKDEKNNQPIFYIFRIRHLDGSWRWMRAQSFNLGKNHAGQVSLTCSFLRDITIEKIIGVSLEEEILRSKVSGGISTLWSGETKQVSGPILSSREKQVLELVRNGRSTKHIAADLGLSITSVNSFRKKLMEKLGANNTAELVRKGYDWKIFEN